MLSVVFGNKKSGKIPFAEDLCIKKSDNRYYIATMRVKSDYDSKKVENHRKARESKGFITIETDVAIVKAIDKIKWMDSLLGGVNGNRCALISTIPALCANEMFLDNSEVVSSKEVVSTILCGLALLKEFFADIVIVSEENPELSYYGDKDLKEKLENGMISDVSIGEYRDAMNELNIALRSLADEVFEAPF